MLEELVSVQQKPWAATSWCSFRASKYVKIGSLGPPCRERPVLLGRSTMVVFLPGARTIHDPHPNVPSCAEQVHEMAVYDMERS